MHARLSSIALPLALALSGCGGDRCTDAERAACQAIEQACLPKCGLGTEPNYGECVRLCNGERTTCLEACPGPMPR